MFRRHFLKLLSFLPFVGPALERKQTHLRVGPAFEPRQYDAMFTSGGTVVYRSPLSADPLNPESWVEVERY